MTLCARCGKEIYETRYGEWKHKPYCGNARAHKAIPKEKESEK